MDTHRVIQFPSASVSTKLADEKKLAELRLSLAKKIGGPSDIRDAEMELLKVQQHK